MAQADCNEGIPPDNIARQAGEYPPQIARSPRSEPREPAVDLDDGMPARCHIRIARVDTAVSCLLTGLAMLAKRGRVILSQEWTPAPLPARGGRWHLADKASTGCSIAIDDRCSAFVDVHDSWEIDPEALRQNDLYFKRSLNRSRVATEMQHKLRPLGLIHDTHAAGFDRFEARRIAMRPVSLPRRTLDLLSMIAHCAAGRFDRGGRATVSALTASPDPRLSPRVIFMVGVWDPSAIPADEIEKIAEFEAVNEMRAGCVRALRREFGARFYGGIQHSVFARGRFPDLLLPDHASSSKLAYLRRLRDYPIGVATTGLHESNGWKLSEYVGLSRAIVSEPLRYSVPGGFTHPTHYLPFSSPEACVEQVALLMDRPAERMQQMQRNRDYYQAWMRPDVLAWRIIQLTRETSAP